MANRLTSSTSPYLLQHKDNPVDWWPWSAAAFEAARSRGVPVLLSVGYAACHWCHVMAHESFEDAGIAAQLNDGFVSVKVDREERPDVDAVYMEVTQAMTGSGGWPMTCFLTPDGNPFFCGTYFPRDAFSQLLTRVSEVWAQRRADVEAQGRDIVRQLAEFSARPAPGGITPALLDGVAAGLAAGFDAERGGFGTSPKFPPSMVLEFLLRHAARTGEDVWIELVAHTCERMARGGIYDQLAGGFARYSVDAGWVVPHFEKMLYDNAQLLRIYAHLWRATGDPLARRVARETAGFLLRDLGTDEGGFASALDADAAGREGSTYVWTPRQLHDVLGAADGEWAAAQFAVSPEGTFEHGTSVLQRLAEPDDPDRYEQIRSRLSRARDERPQPARDDKIVAAWNGLAIAALAEAGALLDEPDWVAAACACARLLRDVHTKASTDGEVRLLRVSRAGRAGPHAGVLEDYGDVAEGLLALHQVTGEAEWLELAGRLLTTVRARFADPAGGFFDTADDAEVLLRRPRDPSDNAAPSGASAAAGALLTYAALTGDGASRQTAERALACAAPLIGRHPRFAGWAAAVAEALLAGPAEVAVVARPDLLRVAQLATAPGAVVVTSGPLAEGRAEPGVYVCRGFVCELPARDEQAVRAQLGVRIS